MLAKCAKCQHVFNTDRFGQQFCPQCGAELFLPDPSGASTQPSQPGSQPPLGGPTAGPWGAGPQQPPPPGGAPYGGAGWQGGAVPPGGYGAPPPGGFGAPPPGGFGPPPPGGFGPDGPQDTPTPWEQRAQKGFFPALVETIKASLFDPMAFFGRMRVDNANGAISYYWIVAGFSGLVGGLWSGVQAKLNIGGVDPSQLPPNLDPQIVQWLVTLGSPKSAISSAIGGAIFAPVALFIGAGVIHLFAMMFGAARNGFSATLRAVAYASGPLVLSAVPMCGGPIGSIWFTVLIIIGLSKTQRSSVGAAVGAVLTPAFIVCCCAVAAAAAVIATAAAAAGAAMGGGY